jgi:hypothetical protein
MSESQEPVDFLQEQFFQRILPKGQVPPIWDGALSPGQFVHRFVSSLPSNRFTKRNWIVLSSGKRSKVFRFLFHKWLFNELTRSELFFLLDNLQEFQFSEFIFDCFRISNIIGKKELRRRLREMKKSVVLPFEISHDRNIGFKSLGIVLLTEIVPDPECEPFSGWRRHQRVAKGRGDRLSLEEESIPVGDFPVERMFSWYEFLLVEDFPSFLKDRVFLKSFKENETR